MRDCSKSNKWVVCFYGSIAGFLVLAGIYVAADFLWFEFMFDCRQMTLVGPPPASWADDSFEREQFLKEWKKTHPNSLKSLLSDSTDM